MADGGEDVRDFSVLVLGFFVVAGGGVFFKDLNQ